MFAIFDEAIVSTLEYLIALCAVFLLATRIVRGMGIESRDMQNAAFLLSCMFIVYAMVVTLGTFGVFNRMALTIGSLVIIALLRGESPRAVQRFKCIVCDLNEGFSRFPILLLPVLAPLMLQVLSPMHGGDSLAYHLPNVAYFVNTGTTSLHRPDLMYDPMDLTAYYMKGMEAVYAFFYQYPAHRFSVVLFKWALLLMLYFILGHVTESRLLSASCVVFIASLEVVQFDLGTLKNDFPLAVFLTYAAAMLLNRKGLSFPSTGIALSLTMALATKANAVFYVAILYGAWLFRERYHLKRVLIPTVCLIIPFGLYFFIVNILNNGSPFFPYGVRALGMQLFPGDEMSRLNSTAIIANLDWRVPLLFLRGLVRQAGPFGTVVITAVFLAVPGHYLGAQFRGKTSAVKGTDLAVLVLWLVGFIITPLSDRNSSVAHGLLYSGDTIRMAFPALLFCLFLFSKILRSAMREPEARHRLWPYGVAVIALLNLLWYDAVCLIYKPENAFASLAAIARTFDNHYLMLVYVAIFALAAVACYWRRQAMPVILIATCAVFFSVSYPQSLAYTMRFKQIGRTTQVFDFIDRDCYSNVSVVLHSSNSSSYFVACMSDCLFGQAERVRYLQDLSLAQDDDLVIVCAKDEENIRDIYRGRSYRESLSFFDEKNIGNRFHKVYEDSFYRIYTKGV